MRLEERKEKIGNKERDKRDIEAKKRDRKKVKGR